MLLEQSVIKPKALAFFQKVFTKFQSRRWQWAIGLPLFLLINGYILYRLKRDWAQVQALDWLHLDSRFLILTAIVQFIGVLIAIFSWMYVLQQFGYQISFWRHFKIYTISNLTRKMPGLGWDILSRVCMYDQDGGNKIQVSVASLSETVIFGVSGAIIALITTILVRNPLEKNYLLFLIGIIVVFLMLLPTPLFSRFLAWVNQNQQNQQDQQPKLQLRWYHLLNWVCLNTCTTTLGGLALFLFCCAFGIVDQNALLPLIRGWALTIASGSLLFWLPESMGVTSGIVVLVLGTLMSTPQAILLLIAWRIWNSLNELVWGGIGFLIR